MVFLLNEDLIYLIFSLFTFAIHDVRYTRYLCGGNRKTMKRRTTFFRFDYDCNYVHGRAMKQE